MKSKYTVDQKKAADDDLFTLVQHASDYDRASLLGKMLYLFHWRFFFRNYGRHFKLTDIPKGRRVDGANYIYNEFLKYWEAEVARARKGNRVPNLVYPIFRQYGLQVFVLGILCFVSHLALVYQALFLEDLIGNFNAINSSVLPEAKWAAKKNLIWACAGILLFSLICTITGNIFFFFSTMISLRVRVCLSEFIYRKALKLSQAAFAKTSTGQIVNLLSTDMTRIDWFFTMVPFPFIGFTLFGYVIYKLWAHLGHYTLYGVLFLSVIVPIQSLIGGIYSRMRMRAAEFTDERIRLVDEFLNAIKIIKVYCWEHPFAQKINEARKKEIGIFKKSLYIYSVSVGLFTSTTKVMIFVILISFWGSGGVITETVAFLALSTFNQCTFIITIFVPHFILCLSNFMISIRRISRFLSLDEKDNLRDNQSSSKIISSIKNSLNVENGRGEKGDRNGHLNGRLQDGVAKEFDLAISDMTACFSVIEGVDNPSFLDDGDKAGAKDAKTVRLLNVLKNINFACRPGELVIVVGPVGSGKTSLLQAILSELHVREGSIQVNGSLSYATQESWIFGGTIRENILFDSEFDAERYEEVIRVCALERDLGLFADGDRTQIGERGIALSGGQKARISLARALYFQAEIYLLDDPLSAVDAHVAKHIFRNAISDYLKSKTVILVTHQLSFMRFADRVLFLKNGEQALYEHSKRAMRRLLDEPDSEFARFIGDYSAQQPSRNRRDSSRTIAGSATNSLQSITQALLPRKNSVMFETLDPIVFDEEEEQNQLKEIKKLEKEKRIKEEDDKVSFAYKAYMDYFRHGNLRFYGLFLLLGFASTQFCASGCDFFLEIWTETVKVQEVNSTGSPPMDEVQGNAFKRFLTQMVLKYDVYLYSALVIGYFVLSLVRIMIHSMFSMRASVAIHKSLFNRMVRAQMTFFYQNPIGIILNRFSRDCGIIDDQLVGSFFDFIDILINDLVIFFFMAFANAYLIIPFLVFITIVIGYRKLYIQTARVIETLEGVAKSPLVQHLTSTLNGLSTIRAFKSESKFVEKFNRYQNDHTAIYFMAVTTRRWFIYVLDNLQMIFVAGSLLVLVLFAEHFSGSMIGLIVTYVLQFSGEFQWCIICWSNLETYLCSVDRIERIGKNLDPSRPTGESLCEPPLESAKDCKPASDWPQKGRIEFRNLTMRYFANEPAVLKDLNFTIQAGDKIGIVGRTGAGKSSILTALFRLTDYEGEIWIDGIHCKSIGLHDLRSKISIIPQEPVLFSGTMRSNLDPLDEYQDHQLWNALRAVQLEKVVKELDGGLDAKVMDAGGNFSTGQKQLICLARAILKENKILVLDEATANTDPATDELIQATIRSVFKHCTILTIAHRLNTIMDSDRILVMDAGEAREFDTPYRLLQDSASLFSSMVDAYGEEQSKILRKIAEDCQPKL